MLAYIDPGSGFPFLAGTTFLWAIILGFLGIFLLFIRRFLKWAKRYWWIIIIILTIIILISMRSKGENNMKEKVMILGIDAMDPNITEKLMAEGKLPNFFRLRNLGSYSRLETTVPSESVVAWSSFSTGLNPGGHGIFDFIMRNPKTYVPFLSLNEVTTVSKEISFGKIKVPIKRLKVHARRKGQTFWNILSKNKIPSYIYFCPNTFPAEPLYGKMLSGMGVPDLYGTMGRFSFYTSKVLSKLDKESRGKIISVKPDNNLVETYIFGPKIASKNGIGETKIPLKIILRPENNLVDIELQSSKFLLERGSWSQWQEVSFNIGWGKKVRGIVKFYLKSIGSDFELYLSPINFDPRSPLFYISYPKSLSKKLAQENGLYFTQGMPHDTWALTEGRVSEETFLEEADFILDENMKILKKELSNFRQGAFFFYFETLDIIQHMFWRYIDPKSSFCEENSPYKDTVYRYYEKMDDILGEISKKVDSDTTLIVLSDHGFNSFKRSVDLNRFLLEMGLLHLKEGYDEGKELFEGIDWSRTSAYALGFGGIYLNKIGKGRWGIVEEAEAQDIVDDICNKLKQWRDPQTGEVIANTVYKKKDIFSGPYAEDGPDLFVGFNKGYRASWKTALGMVSKELIEDNDKKWSGDHLMDPKLVPGVVFVNKKVDLINPSILDVAPTILESFGISKPKEMVGKSLWH